MQERGLLHFIGEHINAGLRDMLSGGEVTHISFDEDTMQLFITAKFDRFLLTELDEMMERWEKYMTEHSHESE